METFKQNTNLVPILWKDNSLHILDQRQVPRKKEYLICKDLDEVIYAIQTMAVRGAPAIAIAGCFGLVLEMQKFTNNKEKPNYFEFVNLCEKLKKARPTAVNLTKVIHSLLSELPLDLWEKMTPQDLTKKLENFASHELEKDKKANLQLGRYGANLFQDLDEVHILTHCNTGALATAGYGTALGIVRYLHNIGKKVTLYANETRPYLQGSRLTAFEMEEEGIPYYILTDGMASWLFSTRKIHAVIVGCDRIARNGDTANKIGTCNLAILAKEFQIPFYVAATKDSFDTNLSSGNQIPIEMRDPKEITELSFLKDKNGQPIIPSGTIAPIGAKALNPAFDITPSKYITKIITEEGVFLPGELPPSLH